MDEFSTPSQRGREIVIAMVEERAQATMSKLRELDNVQWDPSNLPEPTKS